MADTQFDTNQPKPIPMTTELPRVVIVAPDASAKFGGEAILPLHYFRKLRSRGVETWMVLHSRTRNELTTLLEKDIERIYFVENDKLDILFFKIASILPQRIGGPTFGLALRLYTQIRQKRLIKRLITRHQIEIVHEPSPVSPKSPSMMHGFGIPVIIGPMNGGMNYPPPFSHMESKLERNFVGIARRLANLINIVIPGKKKAAILLVANQRTADALPTILTQKPIIELVENGVDLDTFKSQKSQSTVAKDLRFLYLGRLVDWKCVDLLIDVFSDLSHLNIKLDIVGDGPMREELKLKAEQLKISQNIEFHGFLPQKQCADFLSSSLALILPSVYECGGAVVLEAMAMKTAVIATKWGGPADYLDHSCGILVDPTISVSEFKSKLAQGITLLASNTEIARQMGENGYKKILASYNWNTKIDKILEIYNSALNRL